MLLHTKSLPHVSPRPLDKNGGTTACGRTTSGGDR